MKRLNSTVLAVLLLTAPLAALALQKTGQDPNAPAQNSSQLSTEAAQSKAAGENAKKKVKRSSQAEKADKKAAKKEGKVAKDQKKAADANAAAGTPQ